MKKIQCISCQEIIEKHDEEITIKKRNEGLFLLDRERLGEIEDQMIHLTLVENLSFAIANSVANL